jgi:hypothetical protein
VQTESEAHVAPDSYLPSPHDEQTRSEVALGAELSVLPVVQVAQSTQALAFKVLLKVSDGQAVQVRSADFVAGEPTKVPAAQTFVGLHSRFLSGPGGDFSYSSLLHCASAAQTRSWSGLGGLCSNSSSAHAVSGWHDVPSS